MLITPQLLDDGSGSKENEEESDDDDHDEGDEEEGSQHQTSVATVESTTREVEVVVVIDKNQISTHPVISSTVRQARIDDLLQKTRSNVAKKAAARQQALPFEPPLEIPPAIVPAVVDTTVAKKTKKRKSTTPDSSNAQSTPITVEGERPKRIRKSKKRD